MKEKQSIALDVMPLEEYCLIKDSKRKFGLMPTEDVRCVGKQMSVV